MSAPHDHWDELYYILSNASPNGLEIECLSEYIKSIMSPNFDGDYFKAASAALSEWDI